jgi:hypothetical protein
VVGGAEGGGWGTPDWKDDDENWKLPRSGSCGDSYALGIAGTGGTSSSSSPPAELWTLRGLGAGSREVDRVRFGMRMGIEDPPTLSEFKLEFDDSEMPEAYDLRFCSGVARADDGVTLLTKGMTGD